MASLSSSLLCRMVLVAAASALLMMSAGTARADGELKYDFYNASCPGVEELIRTELKAKFAADVTLPAALLRLHFHDCFVRGCDASIMLKSHNGTSEQDSDPNSTLRGYETIEDMKAKVEETCPLVVSCADVMAMAARDAVFFSAGPDYQVETGRRDGNVSILEEALQFLPPDDGNATVLTEYFAVQNLSCKDMIVLSGAHTLGAAHCSSFSKRLYNFTGAGDQDPSLDPDYADKLKKVCTPENVVSVQSLDAMSPTKFDTGYYQSVYSRRTLLSSDAALLDDSLSGAYVQLMNNATNLDTFFADFAVAMINMGRVGVRTGTDGEIRATCGVYVD